MSGRTNRIKDYLSALFAPEDDILLAIKKQAKEARLPSIQVASPVGKLLYTLIKIHKPHKILEIGTLAGYSTVWMARALPPEGRIITLELYPEHVALAKKNIAMAGLESMIEIREGFASEQLDRMIEQEEGPFDLIFIDADKRNYPLYLEKVLQLSRSGTLILSDNLIPKGENIGTPQPNHPEGVSIYQFNELIASHPRLESILTPTIVGSMGRIDALGISLVK